MNMNAPVLLMGLVLLVGGGAYLNGLVSAKYTGAVHASNARVQRRVSEDLRALANAELDAAERIDALRVKNPAESDENGRPPCGEECECTVSF